MRISRKLKLSAWTPVLMAVVIGLALLISHKTMERSLEEGKTTRRIMHGVNELSSFARSYMLYPDDRPMLQFLSEHDSVTELTATIRFNSAEKQEMLENIRHNSRSMKEAFLKLVSNYQHPAQAASTELIEEAEERLAGRVLIQSRGVLSSALRLESLIHDEITTTQRRINILIFFLVIAVTFPLTTALIGMVRNINTSLTALRKGTEVVAAGNLSHRIAISTQDEIGELSRSFDAMTEQLRDTTVSRDELSREVEERKRAEELLRTTLESIGDGFFACDGDWRFIYVNGPAERILDIRRDEVLGKNHWQVFPLTRGTRLEQEFRRAAAGEIRDFENFYEPWGRWFHNRCFPREGGGMSVYFEDITERKQVEEALRASLAEKEVLLKEVHHRVKNNMQVISSLVALQADDTDNAVIRDILQDVTHRIRSMAMVHEKLYQSTDLARVEFADYAQSLLNYLWRAHGSDADGVRLVLDLEPVLLPVNVAVPCGLILNELFSNALKHAFNGRAGGQVTMSLRGDAQGRVRLCVRDNGTGLPEQFDWRQSRSLGLRLVQMLAKQLRAAVEVSSVKGTEFTIAFGGPKT
ncbi:MAG: PAS domain-containing protein [Deltaproteobacteria bacterium]|nr:PAS domain-containing protein [Deltaproteobacteria bacterium]